MSYANNKAFVVRCLDSVMSLVSVTKISSLMLASVAEQASLSLALSETPEDTFSHDETRCSKNLKEWRDSRSNLQVNQTASGNTRRYEDTIQVIGPLIHPPFVRQPVVNGDITAL